MRIAYISLVAAFGACRGTAGEPGDVGPPGTMGAMGTTGPQGMQGQQGFTGMTGAPGASAIEWADATGVVIPGLVGTPSGTPGETNLLYFDGSNGVVWGLNPNVISAGLEPLAGTGDPAFTSTDCTSTPAYYQYGGFPRYAVSTTLSNTGFAVLSDTAAPQTVTLCAVDDNGCSVFSPSCVSSPGSIAAYLATDFTAIEMPTLSITGAVHPVLPH
jgi:hypothetical protein